MPELNNQINIDINSDDFKFLKELYKIMIRYNMHRIYRISYTNGKIVDAHQTLETNIGNNPISSSIYDFLNEYFPFIYFNIFYKMHLHKYRRKLKKLFNKYKINTIGAVSFSLEQGIYISRNQFCICSVDVVKNSGKIFHIDRLYLDI